MLRTIILATAAVLALSGAASAQNYPWKPEKPITLIVPWAAGGSTDQVTRVDGGRNREGARPEGRGRQSGRRVRVDRHPQRHAGAPDGYTWTAGAAKDLGTYVVSGLLDTKITDWRLYLNVVNVSILGVNNNTPYKTAAGRRERHEGEARPGVGRRPPASIRRDTPRSRHSPARSASPTSMCPMTAAIRP